MPAVPSGTVTFLFTDIEGSTTRWEHHPDAMRAALTRHDAVLHDGITAHSGVVVTERGEGDSFFALFAHPHEALAAACALQRVLAAEPWPEEVAPLRVRMALHTGEAGLWEGRDYRGAAVNRCARLRAVAHGGQVLLSHATYELVQDHLPAEVRVRDLGIHRLKDLLQPEHIFEALDPNLLAEFPPLATLDERLRHLPVQLTALVGREREVAQVRGRLLEPGTRLLTLTGPGGIGKTRLALQVAAETVETFPDGVYFVGLAAIRDPLLVLPTIARTLGVVEVPGEPLAQTLDRRLQDTRTLLVLDNLEQVLEAAPEIVGLLAAGPGVKVLVTSRAPLHVRGERLHDVPALDLPTVDRHRPADPGEVAGFAAVRLFVERAQDVAPDFMITGSNPSRIAEICRRLEGLPLAIELAAARVPLLPLPTLLEQLEHRLGVLTEGFRDLPARQRALRDTIAWSYDLLGMVEQTLFRRLGVFAGGGALEAVEHVCGPIPSASVSHILQALQCQSLVRLEDVQGEPRVAMLETIREYAIEQLEASPEAEVVRERHGGYYLELAERLTRELEACEYPPTKGADLVAHLEREHDNLRAALSWFTTHRADAAAGVQLAGALWGFWQDQGHVVEGRRWLEAVLATDAGSAASRARAYTGAGSLAYITCDYVQATVLTTEAVTLYRALGDQWGLALALTHLAAQENILGQTEAVVTHLEECLALCRVARPMRLPQSLTNLGSFLAEQGNVARAAVVLEEAARLYRSQGVASGVALALSNWGEAVRAQGDFMQARVLLLEAIEAAETAGADMFTSYALRNLADVARDQGDIEQALTLYGNSLEHYKDLAVTDKREVASCIEDIIALIVKLPSSQPHLWSEAARLLGASTALRHTIRAPVTPIDRVTYDRTVETLRTLLGEEAFGKAHGVGQTLTLEQAVADAKRIIMRAHDALTRADPAGSTATGPSIGPHSSGGGHDDVAQVVGAAQP